MTSGPPVIRPARPEDVVTLVQFIHDLAAFERSPGSVQIDAAALHQALFEGTPAVFAHVAVSDGPGRGEGTDGERADGADILGMAIWYRTFSTWTGRHGIHLEDLFVRAEARSTGVGRALVVELASLARRAGYGRVEWSVLDWNEPALRFYRGLGGVPLPEWIGYRLDDEALAGLAEGAGSRS